MRNCPASGHPNLVCYQGRGLVKVGRSTRRLILVCLLVLGGMMATPRVLAQGGNPVDIVISEVMFNAAIDTGNRGEWIEIYNSGADPVDLTGWSVRDNTSTDAISASLCPNGSCQIPAGGCWLIAVTQQDLQSEFDLYLNPAGLTVDTTRTIFLGGKIGSGLSNDADGVALVFSTGEVVDCVSWASSAQTFCSGFTYLAGGDGVDTTLTQEGNAQAITNIQGQWYYHEPNGSPYTCSNTAASGTPTAVTLSALSARALPARPATVLLGSLVLAAVLGRTLVRARKHPL